MTGVVPCQTPMTQSLVRAWKIRTTISIFPNNHQLTNDTDHVDGKTLWTSPPPILFSWVPDILLPQKYEFLGLLAFAILPDHRCSLATYNFASKLLSPQVFFFFFFSSLKEAAVGAGQDCLSCILPNAQCLANTESSGNTGWIDEQVNVLELLLGLNEMREVRHLSQRCHILNIQYKAVTVSYYP